MALRYRGVSRTTRPRGGPLEAASRPRAPGLDPRETPARPLTPLPALRGGRPHGPGRPDGLVHRDLCVGPAEVSRRPHPPGEHGEGGGLATGKSGPGEDQLRLPEGALRLVWRPEDPIEHRRLMRRVRVRFPGESRSSQHGLARGGIAPVGPKGPPILRWWEGESSGGPCLESPGNPTGREAGDPSALSGCGPGEPRRTVLYPAPQARVGLEMLTEWIAGNWKGSFPQVFPAFGLKKSWPVVVPT